jgi:hypothetical protein
MFKDARTLDSQRTASAFVAAYRKYLATAEKWFDGSAGSVDRRMTACDRLLHSAKSTVARMSVSESQRYLRAAEALTSDRIALAGLREDLLTGAANWSDPGPPGYRHAKPLPGTSAGSNEFEHPAPRTKHPRWMDESSTLMKAPKTNLTNVTAALHHQAHWFKDDGSYAVPNDGGPHPSMYASPHEYLQARNLHDWVGRSQQMTPGGGDVAVNESWRNPAQAAPAQGPKPLTNPIGQNPYRGVMGSLDGTDRRWVTLESAKFVAANADALDDSGELAVRAHNHAALKTSTFTSQRSAAVCAAFVEQVVDLGAKTYQPPVRVAATEVADIAPEAIFVC